ncbi:MAG TPA: polysaccharide deacetylase family protein [Chloroflexota bacterium]|nr:polysaccharide deacetylase family protein [Chloroflexota bacterium]
MRSPRSNELLGYAADARLLIVNADDFGMCHAINVATLRTFQEGLVRSTSLMVPCPGADHAMGLLAAHPEVPFGVHLTAVCDAVSRRWGPRSPRERVPSLLDETGAFFINERLAELLARAELAELEAEFRAQIEAVLAAGLRPTHLDWHCLHNGGRRDIFEMTLGLAKEYGLALRVAGEPLAPALQRQGLPTNDYDLLDSFALDTPGKAARFAQLLRELPAGLSEWAVHPGYGDDELRALEVGWQVRQADLEFLVSPAAREIVDAEGIILLDYRPLQALWRGASWPAG